MTGMTLPSGCFCLMTGAMLGVLFLGCKLLRGLLRGGRLCTAALDVLFCLICALTVFMCALVIDRGRLRVFQAALQGLGAWGAIVALDPLTGGVERLLRRLGRGVKGWLSRPARFFLGRFRSWRAAAGARRRERRRKKLGERGAIGHGSKPRYSRNPSKGKKYAPKQKKTKNPLEKLT